VPVRGVGSGEGEGAARRVVGARARRVVKRMVSFILMVDDGAWSSEGGSGDDFCCCQRASLEMRV